MNKLNFDIIINAPAEKVWQVLWTDETYRKWTSVFSPTSHAKTDWKEGSTIEFLDGSGGGMYSIIEKKVDNQQMTFRHMGEIKDGQHVPGEWAGAEERYLLHPDKDTTILTVSVDSTEEFENFLSEKFPMALQMVKELAEGSK